MVITLRAKSSRDMDCCKEIVIWNYFDHEHVVGTHFKWYSRFKVIAEKQHWSIVERFYKLPVIRWKTSSVGFMYLDNPNLIVSIQFGKFGMKMMQKIHLADLSPQSCNVVSEYEVEIPGPFQIFQPFLESLFGRVAQKWFDNTWEEDAPMRLRRAHVWKLGFRDFAGIDYINQKTARPQNAEAANRPYPVVLPVPKTPTSGGEPEYSRHFAESVEVGYSLLP